MRNTSARTSSAAGGGCRCGCGTAPDEPAAAAAVGESVKFPVMSARHLEQGFTHILKTL